MENQQVSQTGAPQGQPQGAAAPAQGQSNNQGGQQPQGQQTGQPQGGQPQGGDQLPNDVQGLTQAVQAERTKRQQLEQDLRQAKEQVLLYSMNRLNQPQYPQEGQVPAQGQPQQPQGQNQGQPSYEVGLPDELSKMADDEMVNAGELKKFLGGLKFQGGPAGNAGQDERTQSLVGEEMLKIVKPDAEQVIAGNLAQRIQQSDPMMRQQIVNTIQNAPAMLRPFIAYQLGQGFTPQQAQQNAMSDMQAANMNPASQNVQGQPGYGQQPQMDANQVVQNAQQPTPTSAVANAGAIDHTQRYATMTDEEIDREIEKVKMSG